MAFDCVQNRKVDHTEDINALFNGLERLEAEVMRLRNDTGKINAGNKLETTDIMNTWHEENRAKTEGMMRALIDEHSERHVDHLRRVKDDHSSSLEKHSESLHKQVDKLVQVDSKADQALQKGSLQDKRLQQIETIMFEQAQDLRHIAEEIHALKQDRVGFLQFQSQLDVLQGAVTKMQPFMEEQLRCLQQNLNSFDNMHDMSVDNDKSYKKQISADKSMHDVHAPLATAQAPRAATKGRPQPAGDNAEEPPPASPPVKELQPSHGLEKAFPVQEGPLVTPFADHMFVEPDEKMHTLKDPETLPGSSSPSQEKGAAHSPQAIQAPQAPQEKQEKERHTNARERDPLEVVAEHPLEGDPEPSEPSKSSPRLEPKLEKKDQEEPPKDLKPAATPSKMKGFKDSVRKGYSRMFSRKSAT